MFEIYFDEDDDSPVLAVHATAVAALADLDRICDDTMAQLAANGEGHRCFWLRLAIRDTDSGEVVSRCAIVG